ncbi:hypothetical protein L596_008557 [Steinernema carpocapsae]|uniref:Uncharacterized protein n=1 Tax=Steinernema carpocapsae TaxID=34508 RepID=A0A4U5PD46_STECR|nr:hypothetical protein L596_008557 [Steinernema carpocapsae]
MVDKPRSTPKCCMSPLLISAATSPLISGLPSVESTDLSFFLNPSRLLLAIHIRGDRRLPPMPTFHVGGSSPVLIAKPYANR